MLHGRRPHQNTASKRQRKVVARSSIRILNRELQWRYAGQMMIFSLLLMSFLAVPIWYLVRQNYKIFEKLALDSHPAFLAHLEREQFWIAALLTFGTICLTLLTAWTTLRMTTLWLGPLASIEKHMRKVVHGDWSSHEYVTREADDLRELTGTYNYFYMSLRAQAESELKTLKSLRPDPKKTEAFKAWGELVNLKEKQLGLKVSETSAEIASTQDQRHAS